MQVIFNNEIDLIASRVTKFYDFASDTDRIQIELITGLDSQTRKALKEMEDISFTLSRPGKDNITFEGYTLENISESYDESSESTLLSLVILPEDV